MKKVANVCENFDLWHAKLGHVNVPISTRTKMKKWVNYPISLIQIKMAKHN